MRTALKTQQNNNKRTGHRRFQWGNWSKVENNKLPRAQWLGSSREGLVVAQVGDKLKLKCAPPQAQVFDGARSCCECVPADVRFWPGPVPPPFAVLAACLSLSLSRCLCGSPVRPANQWSSAAVRIICWSQPEANDVQWIIERTKNETEGSGIGRRAR